MRFRFEQDWSLPSFGVDRAAPRRKGRLRFSSLMSSEAALRGARFPGRFCGAELFHFVSQLRGFD